jgi:hypothetical protein
MRMGMSVYEEPDSKPDVIEIQLGLSFLAYNLKRAINLVETKALVAAMRG